MTKNIRMLAGLLPSEVGITATSEHTPATNMLENGGSSAWESVSGVKTATITLTQDDLAAVNCVVLNKVNLSPAAMVTVKFFSGNTEVFNTGTVQAATYIPAYEFIPGITPFGVPLEEVTNYPTFRVWLDTVYIANTVEITVSDELNEDGYLSIGRLFVGEYFSPEVNLEYGVKMTFVDDTKFTRTSAGYFARPGTITKRLTIDLATLSTDEVVRLFSEFATRGKARDVFVSCFPEGGDIKEALYSFCGVRKSDFSGIHDFYENYTSQIVFDEC